MLSKIIFIYLLHRSCKKKTEMKLFNNPFLTSSLTSLSSSPMIPSLIGTAIVQSKPLNLTEQDLTKINLLIPRLCASNHIPEAIRLIDTALAINPPLKSLSISILIYSLSSQPDMTQSMSFITRLKHNPNSNAKLFVLPVTKMLISSYLRKNKPKEALKVFNWMLRPGSICLPDEAVFGVLVCGLCRLGLVFEGLKVLRAMVAAGFEPNGELRGRVFRGLLKEARVRDAKELNESLSFVGADDGDDVLKKVLGVLDVIIANWTE